MILSCDEQGPIYIRYDVTAPLRTVFFFFAFHFNILHSTRVDSISSLQYNASIYSDHEFERHEMNVRILFCWPIILILSVLLLLEIVNYKYLLTTCNIDQ